MGNSDSLQDQREFRFLISPCCRIRHLKGSPVLPHMASPACHPCHPGSLPVSSGSYCHDRHASLPL